MPQFARKYKLPCTGCHDALAYPRLNDVGYKFRRAGFRMPENIGQEELTDFSTTDYFSARVQVDNTTDVTREGGSTDSSNTFTGQLSLYALTGSFQKYFGSETELAFTAGGEAEIENAYASVVYGSQELWFTTRAGVFHTFDGLGGSDRSLGPSRPLIFDLTPNHNQDTLMRMAEQNRIGIDVGLQWGNTSLSVEVVNRAQLVVEDGEVRPRTIGPDAGGGKDLIVVANQILGTHSGLSTYWAHGRVALPIDAAAFTEGANLDTWNNPYDKFGAFASGGAGPLLVLGGAQLGFDRALEPGGGRKRFKSIGGFVEMDVALRPFAVGYVRADYFDPSASLADNHIFAGTIGTLFHQDWVSITPELQIRRLPDATAASLIVHASVIY